MNQPRETSIVKDGLQFCVPDYAFPLLPHKAVFQLIRGLDIDAIDIGLMGGRSHIRPEDLDPDAHGAGARLRQSLDEHELEVADVFLISSGFDPSVLGVNHPDPSQRAASIKMFEQSLVFVAGLGAESMTIGPGSVFGDEPLEHALNRSVEELRLRVDRAATAAVTLCVEPHVGSVIYTPELTLELIDRVPGLRLALDYGHFVYQRIAQARVDPLLAHAGLIHCRGSAPGRMQVSFQENCIDFELVVASAARAGYTGRYSLEYVWTELWRCNEVDNLSEIIRLRDLLHAAAGQTEEGLAPTDIADD